MSVPMVIGHRGASGYRPEHTSAAYELAFRQGAGAVEPDIVASKDGVLVLRHENEISGTTDVASRAEFADRRATKEIDGDMLTGWFTEDFTWAELSTLRAVERLPAIRPVSALFSGRFGILRLEDLMNIVDEQSQLLARELVMVAEIKHAAYFDSIGLPLGELFSAVMRGWATPTNLVTESFELDVLGKIGSVPGKRIFLLEHEPDDLVDLPVDGVSFDKHLIVETDAAGILRDTGLVGRAQSEGLTVYTWTLRIEREFLPEGIDWRTEFATIIQTGVDGVFADHPDLVVALVDEQSVDDLNTDRGRP